LNYCILFSPGICFYVYVFALQTNGI
jgi:hypothetical protein